MTLTEVVPVEYGGTEVRLLPVQEQLGGKGLQTILSRILKYLTVKR